jgi:hypothetical protein
VPHKCKSELYFVTKLRKPRCRTFKIDAVLVEHGHPAFHFPPCHPDLKPVELIRESVKKYAARKNVSFVLALWCYELAKKKFSIIRKKERSSKCNSACQGGQSDLRLEPIIDNISEQIVINLQNGSDTSNCSIRGEGEEEEVAEGNNRELSGTETL